MTCHSYHNTPRKTSHLNNPQTYPSSSSTLRSVSAQMTTQNHDNHSTQPRDHSHTPQSSTPSHPPQHNDDEPSQASLNPHQNPRLPLHHHYHPHPHYPHHPQNATEHAPPQPSQTHHVSSIQTRQQHYPSHPVNHSTYPMPSPSSYHPHHPHHHPTPQPPSDHPTQHHLPPTHADRSSPTHTPPPSPQHLSPSHQHLDTSSPHATSPSLTHANHSDVNPSSNPYQLTPLGWSPLASEAKRKLLQLPLAQIQKLIQTHANDPLVRKGLRENWLTINPNQIKTQHVTLILKNHNQTLWPALLVPLHSHTHNLNVLIIPHTHQNIWYVRVLQPD